MDLFAQRIERALPEFDGETYDPKQDKARLTGQILRVFNRLGDGDRWWSLAELSVQTGDPEASISARLRDLRKRRFGGHDIQRRRRGGVGTGLWEYRLGRGGEMRFTKKDAQACLDSGYMGKAEGSEGLKAISISTMRVVSAHCEPVTLLTILYDNGEIYERQTGDSGEIRWYQVEPPEVGLPLKFNFRPGEYLCPTCQGGSARPEGGEG